MKLVKIKIDRDIVSETETSITFRIKFNPNRIGCQCYKNCDCTQEFYRDGKHKERIEQFNTYQKYGKVKAKVSETIEGVKEWESKIEDGYNQFHTKKEPNDLTHLFEKTVEVKRKYKNGRFRYPDGSI